MNAELARQRSRVYAGLANGFSEPKAGLEREFTRLFQGPGRPVAHPYGSVYLEGQTMGETTRDVYRRLVSEGVAPEGRTLPDHVSIELAFMAHLTRREADARERDEQVQGLLDRQHRFLQEHLLAWLPQFCSRVLAGRPATHYARLIHLAEDFVRDDAARVHSWLDDGAGPAPGGARVAQRWTVTVGPGCTLCDLCVQVCRPGAVQLVLDAGDRRASLCFDAGLCDGCAACERWCPEHAVTLDRLPAGPPLPPGELAGSALAVCRRCGEPYAPEAMIARVQAQVRHSPGLDHDALLQRLALCQKCKAIGVPLRPRKRVPATDLAGESPSRPQEE